MYLRYLQKLYGKANAAWRVQMRKHAKPCAICGDANAEITPEEMWLCRAHKAIWKQAAPYKSYAQRLTELGVSFLTEEEYLAGCITPKRNKRIRSTLEVKSWDYSVGPVKRATTKKKK